jgi:invasion protein IalB
MTTTVDAVLIRCMRLAVLLPLALGLGATAAMAETKAPRKVEKKQQHQPEPAPQQAQPQPAPQQAAPQQAAPAAPLPPVVYSTWTKICPKPPANAPQPVKLICLTVKEMRLETGQFLAGAALIEQQGEEKKLLRVTLPLGMQLAPGTRVTLDAEQPASASYVVCVPNGCMADYQIDAAYVARLKKGQQLTLQGVSMVGQVASFPLPLAELAKALDGPPTDQEEFDKRQKAEWEKRLKDHQQQQNAPQAAPKK